MGTQKNKEKNTANSDEDILQQNFSILFEKIKHNLFKIR